MKSVSSHYQRSRLRAKINVIAKRLVFAAKAVVIGFVTTASSLSFSASKSAPGPVIVKPAGAPLPMNHDDSFEPFTSRQDAKESKHLGFARSKIIAIAEKRNENKKDEKKDVKNDFKKSLTLAQSENEAALTDSSQEQQSETPTAETRKASYAEPQESKRKTNYAESVTGGVRVEDIVEQSEVYRFSGLDKPDPFLAPVKVVETVKSQSLDAEEIPIISPLQYYDLKSLLVTGVWETDKGQWKAMIETPDHQGIIAKSQDAVGNSGGRITEISRYGVLVREYKLRKDGTQEFSDRMMPMAKESDVSDDFKGGTIVLTPGAVQPEVIRPQAEVVQTPPSETPEKVVVKESASNALKDAIKENPSSNTVPAQAPVSVPVDSMNPVVNGGRL